MSLTQQLLDLWDKPNVYRRPPPGIQPYDTVRLAFPFFNDAGADVGDIGVVVRRRGADVVILFDDAECKARIPLICVERI